MFIDQSDTLVMANGKTDYWPNEYKSEPEWLSLVQTIDATECQVERFEARSRFEFFTSMGNISTEDEVADIVAHHKENPLVYTEDRAYPIRLTRTLPVRWLQREPDGRFEGWARPGEYYVWQLGVYAAHDALSDIRLTFGDLKRDKGEQRISSDEMTCFNQEGTNWDGKPITFHVDVPKGKLQAMWCGIQVPQDLPAGTYKGSVRLTGGGMSPRDVEVTLHVEGELLADGGDSELWRMSRLRWLNSTIGMDNHPVSPYEGMKIKGKKIKATEKTVKLMENGLPASVCINDREVLRAPIRVIVETDKGSLTLEGGDLKIVREDDGLVTWTSRVEEDGVVYDCKAWMEYDGYMRYHVRLSSAEAQQLSVRDIRMEIPYTAYSSAYFMGIGFDGGACPESYSWDWTGLYDSYWMGGVLAGLHTEFRGSTYHGPLMRDYQPQPPMSWWNEGRGRVKMRRGSDGLATVTTSTGETMLTQDGTEFEFALTITPQKPVDTKRQFGIRIFHGDYRQFDKAALDGANICNLHHATTLNPVINYPFIVQEPLKEFIRHEHEEGRMVKLYYTIRELTNHVAEVYALKSLGGEVIASGVGGGAPWLCEHLLEDYRPAWYVTFSPDDCDAAFVQSGFSRWINYYLEGFRWMLQHYEIDGLYMDDVSFDRQVMKRIRKIMMTYRPTSQIDLHSNTAYSHGPACQYADFMPYVDRLLFGESFQYNRLKADEWLVTFSGVPFGPMSEMLQDGGNGYLGAVYGATTRLGWPGDAVPVLTQWHRFGIEESRMMGYWDEHCPVKTNDNEVKATVYVKKNCAMIVLGNFSEQEKRVRLTFDWKTLHMNPKRVKLYAPQMERYQVERTFALDEDLLIEGKKGWTLILE